MNRRRIIFSITSLIIAFFIATDGTTVKDEYVNLWQLPFITAILYCIPIHKTQSYLTDSLSFIIETAIFIRNCLSPLMLRISDYEAIISNNTKSNIDRAIFLICIETLCILIIAYYKTKKKKSKELLNKKNAVKQVSLQLGNLYALLMMLVGVGCIFCIYMSPQVLSKYTPIWKISDIRDTVITDPSLFITIFSILFAVFMAMFVLYLISIACRNRKQGIGSIFILIVAIFSSAFFTAENYGYVLISAVVTYLFVCQILEKQNRGLTVSVAAIALFILFTALSIKGFNEDGGTKYLAKDISLFLQAYVPGVSNLAGVFNISNIDTSVPLFYDFYFMIPFRNTLLGIPGDLRSAIYFNEANYVNSQIIPCVGQTFLYFGYFGTLISCLPIAWAYSIANKLRNTEKKTLDYILIYACIYCALTPFLYNYTILGSWLFMTLLPAYLFLWVPIYLKKLSYK